MSPPDDHADAPAEFVSEPQRVSKTSVLSLVAGLLSCLPLVGMVAAILGVAALHRIGRSGGRLGGRTFAAVGMTFGLIATALWLSVILGVRQEYASYKAVFAAPATEYFEKVEGGDWTAARAIFEPGLAPSEELCTAFAADLRRVAGRPAGPLASLEDFRGLSAAASHMPPPKFDRAYAGRPMRFEHEVVFVTIRMAKGKPDPKNRFPAEGVEEVCVITRGGEVLKLAAPEHATAAKEKTP